MQPDKCDVQTTISLFVCLYCYIYRCVEEVEVFLETQDKDSLKTTRFVTPHL